MNIYRFYSLLVLVWVLSGFDIWLSRAGISQLQPWLLTLVISLPCFCAAIADRRVQRELRSLLVGNDKTLALFCAFSAFLGFWALIPFGTGGGAKVIGSLSVYGIYIAILGASITLKSGGRIVNLAIIISIAIVALTIIADYIRPGTFSDRSVRSGGLLDNPNASSARILILGALIFYGSQISVLSAGTLVLGGLSIFITQSRGSLFVLLVVLITASIYRRSFRLRLPIRGSKITMALVIIVATILFAWGGRIVAGFESWQNKAMQERLMIFTNSSVAIKEDVRLQLVQTYLKSAIQSPLFGYGVGYSQGNDDRKPPHNLYIRLWVDYGLIGLMLFNIMLIVALRLNYHVRCFPAFIFWCSIVGLAVFSHTLIENRGLLLGIGIAVVLTRWHILENNALQAQRYNSVVSNRINHKRIIRLNNA
jgi:hypothetical protein